MSKLPAWTIKKDDGHKLSNEDESALLEYCSGIELEEIEFDNWKRCHEDLNIIIPLYISLEDSQKGGPTELRFSREVIDSEGKVRREKACVTLDIPSLVEDGCTLEIKASGSVQDVSRGDLRVIIRIKR